MSEKQNAEQSQEAQATGSGLKGSVRPMDAETLLSGIREMIAAAVRVQTTTDPEERRIAGELYTINEGVVRSGLLHLFEADRSLRESVRFNAMLARGWRA